MADQIYDKIVIRNDIEANWVSANPVLLEGEVGITMDTTPKKFKVGNGTSAWSELPYHNPSVTISDIPRLQAALDGKEPTKGADDNYVTTTEKTTWNAKAETSDIPTALSELTDDTTHRLVTDTEKTTWNDKADISDIPTDFNTLYYTKSEIDTKIGDIETLLEAI